VRELGPPHVGRRRWCERKGRKRRPSGERLPVAVSREGERGHGRHRKPPIDGYRVSPAQKKARHGTKNRSENKKKDGGVNSPPNRKYIDSSWAFVGHAEKKKRSVGYSPNRRHGDEQMVEHAGRRRRRRLIFPARRAN